MFGGANTTYQGGTYFGDTWLFEGGSWTQINPPISPPARVDAASASDAADGYIVMFGGVGAGTNNILADTWTFRGGTWTQLAPPPAPSPSGRDASEMTFDAADGKIILFGGYDLSSGWLNDTWTFSAGSWTQLTPSVSPQPRASPTLAYDAIDGYVLLFGGNGNRGYLNDTWTFLGGSWTQLVPSVSPPSRDLPAIAYDGKGGYIVIFGGWNTRGGVLGDTWVYAAHLIAFVSIN